MDTKELDEQRTVVLERMREAFTYGRFAEVSDLLEELGDTKTIRSGIRVEAIVLAARAKTASGDKSGARLLLKHVWNGSLKNHRLCRHVAIACLELGEYRRAADLSERAALLAEQAREVSASN